MRAYRLMKDGQMVHTFRSTTIAPDGREEHLTRGEVGYAGKVYTDLPQHVVDAIDAGETGDTWEAFDLEDEDEPDQPVVVVAPTAPAHYDKMSPRELMELATERHLNVEGTGESGRILKSDIIAVLEADDEEG
jgi:hypothetical protein